MCMIALRCGRLFLNEVLSLNAQECERMTQEMVHSSVLNEVLSLNAQEFRLFMRSRHVHHLLNEVLSLNAQESGSQSTCRQSS